MGGLTEDYEDVLRTEVNAISPVLTLHSVGSHMNKRIYAVLNIFSAIFVDKFLLGIVN